MMSTTMAALDSLLNAGNPMFLINVMWIIGLFMGFYRFIYKFVDRTKLSDKKKNILTGIIAAIILYIFLVAAFSFLIKNNWIVWKTITRSI